MSRRLLITFATLAFTAMTAAVVWLVVAMNAPELPTDVQAEKASTTRKTNVSLSTGTLHLPATLAKGDASDAAADPAAELAAALQSPHAVPGEALLSFKDKAALDAFRARAAAGGLEIISVDPVLLTARVRYKDPAALMAEVRDHADEITHAGPNLVARIPGLPAQPQKDTANAGGAAQFRSQGLDLIGAPANRAGWGKGVTVAVLDSGVTDHPALAGVVTAHVDLVGDGSAMHGHGTAMASLVAGHDATAAGVAPDTQILDIRVADAQGQSNTAILSQGIIRAVQAGAKVINISLGSAQSSPVLEEAVRYAQASGAVIIAAAGNEQHSQLSYPAGIPGVVSVGAIDATGAQAWFSNSGTGLSVVAPGVGIVSAYSDGKIVIGSGTSQAAAITSGVAAYLIGRGYPSTNIPSVITRNARPTGAPVTAVGSGILRIP